jgi:hypothetical protein
MSRQPHLLAHRRFWILPVLVVVLLAGHGVMLYYGFSHVIPSAAALSGAILLLVIKHLGLLGPVSAWFRRRRSRNGP